MMRAYEFVTNTPVTLDEHRGYLADDVSLVRTSPPLSPPIKVLAGAGMIERCVVVQRQHDGYGFTVTGDHPVFVHTVKLEGAAFCAGVREGDRILKVNGMPVTSNNHLDVVRMISGGQNVVLTLLGAPPEPLGSYMIPDSKNDSKFNITDSMFTDGATKDEWKKKRKEILSQMLDEERRHVEGLRETSENGDKLDRALKRIVSLQSQLRHIKPAEPIWNQQSVPMDGDTDEDETECLPIDNHGLFSNLAEMKTHPAHLAVFINYLLSNANPSSLFFYLITDAFQSAQGTAKDFRRWAFEIFTTFIIPNSPMLIPNSDQSIIQPIDKILATTAEHISDSDVEILKRVFVPGRQRAVADINEHMADFRQKRQLGLGSIFDANQLAHLVRGDRAMETRVGEQLMFRSLDNIIGSISELDACEMQMRTQAIIASLSTVIRIVLGSKPSTTAWEKMMERCPQFLMKDKGGKGRKPPSNLKSKAQIKGHMFIINPVNTVHYCYQCRDAIWGMQPWCYFCNNCDVKVHAYCTSSLTDACYPATQSKQKSKTRKSGLVGKSDAEEDEPPRPEHNVKSTSSDSGIGQEIHEKPVGRSHSMRNRATIPQHVDDRVTKRDRSTPSWGSDLPPADEEEEGGRRNRSIDGRSEARSLEGSRLVIDLQSISGSSSISHASIAEDEVKRMWERMQTSAISEGDSDMEVETEAPSLDQIVDWDIIRHLKPKEKKRQEVINELFHTERTHVRNLKILLNVFYKPMLANNIVSPDVVHLLFANLDEVLEIHIEMCAKMRRSVEQWRRENNHGLYGNIGELMEGMFDGEAGEKLMQVTSMFCQHQQHALDILRARCKKDKEDGLVKFLADAEANPLCRKLQLKDMIPVEMQRLVKYPLLIETIAKYTNEKGEEQDRLLRTVISAKRILSAVNTAKRNAENLRRLEELQRRMDTTPFDKEYSGHDYAYLNLTKYRLVHDGPLTCRFNRGKLVDLHVVLLENMVVFLTKHSDGNKLQLKTLEPSKETKWSPIMPLGPLAAREKANDKRAFFLIFNSHYGAQIYELVAATATERKTWFKLMSDQISQNDTKHQKQGIDHYPFEVGASTSVDSDGVAKVHVLTHPRLVHASEITVQQPTVLEHAQPILTPTERLRRSDEVIFEALLTKHTILSQFLPGDKKGRAEELEKLTELLGGLAVADLKQRDCKELAMSAIVHGNRLLDSINQGMNSHKEADESNPGSSVLVLDDSEKNLPSVPCYRLTAIAAPLMNHLKALMQVIQDQQNELNTVKQQLYHYKELTEMGHHDRSVSEETLTEGMADPTERKLITKRQRTPSIQPLT